MAVPEWAGWSYVGRDGKPILEGIYTGVSQVRDGMGVVWTKERARVLRFDRGRAEVVGEFDDARDPGENSVPVLTGKEWSIIDKSGRPIVDRRFGEPPCAFASGLACVNIDGTWGYIDRTGRVAIEPLYESAEEFSGGFAIVRREGQTYFIKPNGTILAGPFDDAMPFSERFAAVKAGSFWGYLNSNGEIVIAAKFDAALSFHDGLAPVHRDTAWSYIDRRGNVAIPGRFDRAGVFSSGLAAVALGREWGYIDTAGAFVIAAKYDSADTFRNGRAIVSLDDTVLMLSSDGREIRQIH